MTCDGSGLLGEVGSELADVECPGCDECDVERWSKERVILYLARHGCSPLDQERSFERVMAKLKEFTP